MENKEFKSVFLPKEARKKDIGTAMLFKLPSAYGEVDKYFWASSKLIHNIGRNYVLNYGDNFTFTIFEQVKNEQGFYEKKHEQSVDGDFIKGVFAKESKEIEQKYLEWQQANNLSCK